MNETNVCFKACFDVCYSSKAKFFDIFKTMLVKTVPTTGDSPEYTSDPVNRSFTLDSSQTTAKDCLLYLSSNCRYIGVDGTGKCVIYCFSAYSQYAAHIPYIYWTK